MKTEDPPLPKALSRVMAALGKEAKPNVTRRADMAAGTAPISKGSYKDRQ